MTMYQNHTSGSIGAQVQYTGAGLTAPTPTRMADTVESLQKATVRLGALVERSQRTIGNLVGGWPQEAEQQPNEAGSDMASQLRGLDNHFHRKISQLEQAIEMLEDRALHPSCTDASPAKSLR